LAPRQGNPAAKAEFALPPGRPIEHHFRPGLEKCADLDHNNGSLTVAFKSALALFLSVFARADENSAAGWSRSSESFLATAHLFFGVEIMVVKLVHPLSPYDFFKKESES